MCSISLFGDKLTDKANAKLTETWKEYEYFIIDECSMISKSFLAKISGNIAVAKSAVDGSRLTQAFGGVNVILSSDMHQFPPVAGGERAALYTPCMPSDSVSNHVGHALYKDFETIVLLKEQMRVNDEVWMGFPSGFATRGCEGGPHFHA